MYRNILIATDGSELAMRGAKQAIAMAKGLDAKTIAVYATEPFHWFVPDMSPAAQPAYVEATREAASRVLGAVAEHATVTTLVSSEGRALTEFRLSVKNRGQLFVKVGLPKGATIFKGRGCGECNGKGLRGRVGIVIPGREALLARLAAVKRALEGTRFAFSEHEGYVEAVSPWGNVIRCHEPEPRFGPVRLAMPYVELDVPPGAAEGIARFYREIVGAPAHYAAEERAAYVPAGPNQELVYRETERPIPPYDGHHVQVYIADFSGPHRRLLERGLITEESDQHQYRFVDLVDPASGKVLFQLEHEVRSMRHPLYARPLVNRNPTQSNLDYAPGYDAEPWGEPHPERA